MIKRFRLFPPAIFRYHSVNVTKTAALTFTRWLMIIHRSKLFNVTTQLHNLFCFG